MIIPNQKTLVGWSTSNKKHYESIKDVNGNQKYFWTKQGDKFLVDINDLLPYSRAIIKVECDYCNGEIEKEYANYLVETKRNGHVHKDACEKCSGKKVKEINDLKYEKPKERKCSKCKRSLPLTEEYFNKSGSARRTNYRYKCRDCCKEDYHENKVLINDKYFNSEEALDTYKTSLETNEILPQNFWDRMDFNSQKRIIDYIVKENSNEYDNDFMNVNTKFVRKYRLDYFIRKYENIYKFLQEFYKEKEILPWKLKGCVPNGYWGDDNNKLFALKWFINQIKKDGIIKEINDLPKVCSYKLFEKYGIGGLVSNYFNASPFDAINFLHPDLFKPWQFIITRKGFYDDEMAKSILEWFIELLLKDDVINDINDIPDNVNIYTFDKYNLKSFLMWRFNGATYQAFNFLYPDKWKPWEFKSCPSGYWKKLNNVKDALEWFFDKLIEDQIITDYHELSEIPINGLLKDYNLASILNTYTYDLTELLKKLFPKIFKNGYKNHTKIAKDGTKLLSDGELLIHNFLIDNFNNVKYFKTHVKEDEKFHNIKENENYVPDWIINDKVIIEFFGMYNEKLKDKDNRFGIYARKTLRKIEYFNNLNNYEFISLFPEDISHSLEGVKNKLNKYINVQRFYIVN